MFLPIGDEPNPRGTAWANWLLIAANVAVYALATLPLSATAADAQSPVFVEYARVLAQVLGPTDALREALAHLSAYDLFVFENGFRPSDPTMHGAFTAMFLHAGFAHLAGNMLFLWIFGDNIEARLGRGAYLAAYLSTGMAGNAAHALMSGGSPMPLVGASGAISGVLGLYFVLFPENRVRVLVALFPIYVNVVHIRARWVLGAYFVVDNVLPVLLGQPSPVAYGAHIGGFVSGFLLARLLRSRDAAPPREIAPPSRTALPPTPAAEVSRRLQARDLPGAASLYVEGWGHAWLRDVPAGDALVIADWMAAQGQARAALAVYQRMLAFPTTREEEARAHLGAGLALLHGLHRPTDAYQQLVRAVQLDADPAITRAAQGALQRIRALQKLTFRGQ